MDYDFDIAIDTANYEVQISFSARYGFFEHNHYGEERGGGLWFGMTEDGRLELLDYDGLAYLPAEVINALRETDIAVDEEFE